MKVWLRKQWAALRRWAQGKWRRWRAERWTWWVARAAIIAAIVLGVIGVERATNIRVALILLVAALLPALPRFAEVAGRLGGALLIAAVALVGVNIVLWRLLHILDNPLHTGDRLPVWLGLFVAIAVIFFIARWYLRRAQWTPAWIVYAPAAAVALVGILVPPILKEELGTEHRARVSAALPVRSALDVLIVTDGTTHPAPSHVAADPTLSGFDVRYSVGVADGSSVRWKLVDDKSPRNALVMIARGREAPDVRAIPARRASADPALVLVVDGTPPVFATPDSLDDVAAGNDDVERWRRVTRSVRAAIDDRRDATPAFALLQTTGKDQLGKDRLGDWDSFTAGGISASVQGLQALSLTDAALMLAIGDSRADFALAFQFRPALLFDGGEPVPRPLSINKLFKDGKVFVCDDKPLAGDGCPKQATIDPRQLVSGGKHLKLVRPHSDQLRRIAFEDRKRSRDDVEAAKKVPAVAAPPEGTPPPNTTELAPIGAGSSIYVHPVRRGDLLYLDYWWYLADNPARAGAGSMCGAGLVISGATCHDHESDWEGVTVVLDRSGAEPIVQAVNYAQHNRVVAYPWSDLRAYWDKHLGRFKARVVEPDNRPLVFVASGTHASYPTPCRSGDCKQVGGSRIAELGENRHDGELEWGPNNARVCGDELCLQLLPSVGGQQPALWDDFTGAWGQTHCFLKYYCDSGDPPGAPGHQARYGDPAKATRHDGPVER